MKIQLFRIKETFIYKAFLKPLCFNTWSLLKMRPTAQSPVLKWGEKILQGMRGSTHNTFPEPHIPVFNNLLNR